MPGRGIGSSAILPRRMAKRRRTSGVQKRDRASSEAMSRRIDQGSTPVLPDWRLLLIGGVLVVGVLILALVLLFGGTPSASLGVQQQNDGGQHVSPGTDCRDPAQQNDQTLCSTAPYSSLPAASGPHWDPSALANWGVYSTPQPETQLIHSLEHGGVVIWYDPAVLDAESIDALTNYVNTQTASGVSGRYKFILSPWGGADPLPAPIVASTWRWLLELETGDTDRIDEFAREHYGDAPEPNGGPGPPG
jgi:Protein of unknown function (DUF3105)